MMAVGVCLLLFGYVVMKTFPSKGITWRDTFGLLPVAAGAVLCFVSGIVWLWRNMP